MSQAYAEGDLDAIAKGKAALRKGGKAKGKGSYGRAKTNDDQSGGGKGPTNGFTGGFQRPFYGECNECGLIGHSKAQCPSLGRGFKGDCSACGIKGHKAALCPKSSSPKGKGAQSWGKGKGKGVSEVSQGNESENLGAANAINFGGGISGFTLGDCHAVTWEPVTHSSVCGWPKLKGEPTMKLEPNSRSEVEQSWKAVRSKRSKFVKFLGGINAVEQASQ